MRGTLAWARAVSSVAWHWFRVAILEGGMVKKLTLQALPTPLSVPFLRATCRADIEDNELAETQSADEENLDDGSRVGVKGVNGETSRLLVVSGKKPDETLRYIVKRPPPEGSKVREVAGLQRWPERECKFYTELAQFVPCKTPRCVLAERRDAIDFVLVLEELQPAEWFTHDDAQGLTFRQALAAVCAIGKVHAAFRSSPHLDKSWLPILPVQLPLVPFLVSHLETVWPAVEKIHRDDIPEDIRAKVGALASQYEALSERLAAAPRTLVHGDFRAENMRFRIATPGLSSPTPNSISPSTLTPGDLAAGGEVEVAVFDWAMCSQGNGVYDFVYVLVLSLTRDTLRKHEQALEDAYCHAAGITNDAQLRELKQAALLIIFASYIFGAVAGVEDESARPTHAIGFQRLCAAIEEWDAMRLL
ncbi:Hypothetical Protein FCC1311_028842 [Hondaea fermentalgiana]|uniref:Aminoglycoside phosphotransferase domain-containing protein n=1 Tax=Hondaea fermentalgiana TaxID=2315210 RepID=A0A2R5GDE9_9STRA|nr:Hypothetical Protein FCC1311_028842 [Hondaea fermentalgiana]|eukprot:GBG26663.1 Hypothetical Protein FCC1311_028842 [Hondaea fermentalgiana]